MGDMNVQLSEVDKTECEKNFMRHIPVLPFVDQTQYVDGCHFVYHIYFK
jgi:hypothetical protein